jgi:PAS domain S-box-containing protein
MKDTAGLDAELPADLLAELLLYERSCLEHASEARPEEALRTLAAACAATGLPLQFWSERAEARMRDLLPVLRKAHEAAPDRLLDAVLELQQHFARQLAAIGDTTVAEQGRVARLWEERNRAVFEDSPLTMWIYDTATLRITEANHASRAQYGYTLEEFQQLTVPDLWPAEDREKVMGHVTKPPSRSIVHGRQRRKDGSIFWIESYGSAYPDVTRKTRLAVLKDVTQERLTEEARHRAEVRFERLSSSGVVGILIVNLDDLRVLDINPALCGMLGYSREEFLSGAVSWKALTPEEWAPVDVTATAQLRAHGFAGLREKEYLRKDGTRCPVLVATTLVGASETISCVLDLTERKRMQAAHAANAALEIKTAQLQVANAELESFSYSVAHDLRAPLQATLGFTQLSLESPNLDALVRESLKEIESSSRKMSELIDALLELSKMTRSKMRLERVDLSEVARSIVERLAKRDPDRDIVVRVEDGLTAEADTNLARAMLDNLIGNAWKFTGKAIAPRIEFGRGEDDRDQPSFFVRDNGAGFDMADAEKLFAPFQRLHTFGEFPGTGIGLATVSRIVRRHGGRVWAEGKVNGGATFHFTLPTHR